MGKRPVPTSIDFEITNVEEVNENISECEIRVFYHGKNRNGSYISKAVGDQIARTLPRSPIVALYDEEVEDFADHGEEVVINHKGVSFEKKTIPYGVVSETAPTRWEKVTNEHGEEKEYLIAQGYLWTGRYPFLDSVIEDSKGQSMEFFEESVSGNWAKFDNEEDEYFIFNEADISALCILGDGVEPCFEDAKIGRPEIIYSLVKDDFKKDLNEFMFELNETLDREQKEGGAIVDKEISEFAVTEAKEAVKKAEETKTKEDISAAKTKVGELEYGTEKENLQERLSKIEVKKEEKSEDKKEEEFENVEEKIDENEEIVEDDSFSELQKEYNLLEAQLKELQEQFNLLTQENEAKELKEKKEICEKFSILGEDVIAEFSAKLDEFSVEELEKELSFIAFNKDITFNLLSEKEGITTPVLDKKNKNLPAWLGAIKKKETEQ